MELFTLSDSEFGFWKERSIREYTLETMRGNGLTAAEAEEKAKADFNRLLPEGLSTKDHYIFSLKDKGELIGYIWFCERGAIDNRKAYLCDIVVEENKRGMGHGKKAMLILEEKVRDLGLKHIGLHVFGHNLRAQELYKKLGYGITNIVMEKVLN